VIASPSLEEFLKVAHEEFEFLHSEFGYLEIPAGANPYATCYRNHGGTILVEGINWGFGVNVILHSPDQWVPLWAIAKVRGGSQVVGTQLAQLKGYASLLREVASDVLAGSYAVFQSAADEMSRVIAETQEKKPGAIPKWL
jgi:hypothetical protein